MADDSKTWSREKKVETVLAYRSSGLTIKQYAAQIGIPSSSLGYWNKRENDRWATPADTPRPKSVAGTVVGGTFPIPQKIAGAAKKATQDTAAKIGVDLALEVAALREANAGLTSQLDNERAKVVSLQKVVMILGHQLVE